MSSCIRVHHEEDAHLVTELHPILSLLPSLLLPGDVILADRGFTIEKAAGMYCAEVKVPPFTRGKK